MEWLRNVWDRMAHNWATSSVAILAGVEVVAGWFGFTIVRGDIALLVTALVLLFAKDK